jgi:hypothetical protein
VAAPLLDAAALVFFSGTAFTLPKKSFTTCHVHYYYTLYPSFMSLTNGLDGGEAALGAATGAVTVGGSFLVTTALGVLANSRCIYCYAVSIVVVNGERVSTNSVRSS